MIDDLVIPCDRVTFRDGQRLASRDLRDVRRRHGRLRRLHHHVLHDTWGIALGFEVTRADASADEADFGSTAVVVNPGYALDDSGNELLLAESVHVPVPRVSGPDPEIRVLTARHQDDAAYLDRRLVVADCLASGLERPLFSWRRQEETPFGAEVPLAQAELDASGIVGPLDLRVRRFSRPASRPHMAHGTTEAGRTGWRQWIEADVPRGLEVVVDTSQAGFSQDPNAAGTGPFYFAALEGDFSNRANQQLVDPDVWAGTTPSFFLNAFGFITTASPTSFTYRLLHVDHLPLLRIPTEPAVAESRQWTVSWLGLEPVRGCEPLSGDDDG